MESKPFIVLGISNIKSMLMSSHGALAKGEEHGVHETLP